MNKRYLLFLSSLLILFIIENSFAQVVQSTDEVQALTQPTYHYIAIPQFLKIFISF